MLEDFGMDEMELLVIKTTDLNRILKEKKIDEKRQKIIKGRKRTLKNR
jgi:hypothetical protein